MFRVIHLSSIPYQIPLWLAASFSLPLFANITDPLPDPVPGALSGVKLVEFVQIPDAPVNGSAPRLNMLRESPDGTGRLWVIDQYGYMYVIPEGAAPLLYLNVREELEGALAFTYTGGQGGLTSFAFHPEFSTNGLFYTVTSTPTSTGTPDFSATRPIDKGDGIARSPSHHDLVLEWKATNPSANSFSGSVRKIMRVEQPFTDHNVGEVTFNPHAEPGDPDYGLLYIAVADGGNNWPFLDPDPLNNGQNRATLHGSVIRIDPLGNNSANGAYGVPEDNPFVGAIDGSLPELWTHGHRNNHRLEWDSATGDLYNFEMGQFYIEEINILQPGGNYGWDDREGSFVLADRDETKLTALPENEVPGTYIYPVAQYDHPPGVNDRGAISDGVIYRGPNFPELYGKLVFADFTERVDAVFYVDTADIPNLGFAESVPVYIARVFDGDDNETTLGEIIQGTAGARTDVRFSADLEGEIYITNKHNGWVYKLVEPAIAPDFEVSASPLEFGPEGGTVVLQVDTTEAAAWTMYLGAEWISLEGGLARTGSQTLEVEVAPLAADNHRSAVLVVAGTSFDIVQAREGDLYDLFPDAVDYPGTGYVSAWPGWMWITDFPWVWHWPLEWVYIAPDFSSVDTHYWYSYFYNAWLFTAPDYYPWIYDYGSGEWIEVN